MQGNTKENKMGVMPIPKLLLTIAFPLIISMMVQALYNIVDSIFVAKISEDALTAVSLAFPIQNLMIAVAVGTGVAINALIGKNLGEQNFKMCGILAKNSFFLSVMNYLVFLVIGILGSEIFFHMQTDNAVIVDYGSQYMFIVTTCSVGLFTQITFERYLQTTGQTVLTMITQGMGAIINIILDPILIFGLFGFPRLEVVGAALATVIGQISAAILGYYFVRTRIKQFDINMKGFRPDKNAIKRIYVIGIPAIIMQSIASIMTLGLNTIVIAFSTTATAVLGIYFKLQSFVFLPIYGVTNGFISIVAYNYGAKNKKRIVQVYKLAIVICCAYMLAGTLAFSFLPEQLLSMFEASEEMLVIGTSALRLCSIGFVFAGYSIVSSSLFQALGATPYSLVISLGRQLVIVLPVAYALSRIIGLDGVWYAVAIAEIVSIFVCVVFVRKIYRERIKVL